MRVHACKMLQVGKEGRKDNLIEYQKISEGNHRDHDTRPWGKNPLPTRYTSIQGETRKLKFDQELHPCTGYTVEEVEVP